MPRIYAPNEAHDMAWGHVDFVNGVAAVSRGANVAYWTAEGYTIDNSKHALDLLDELTPAQLRGLCAYLGITIDQGQDPDSKHVLVRAIEGSISTKYLGAVVVSSAAGTAVGDTAITITGAGTYKYKVGATAPAPYYMDDVSDWTTIVTGAQVTAATGTFITVAKVDASGHVIASGSDEVVAKA